MQILKIFFKKTSKEKIIIISLVFLSGLAAYIFYLNWQRVKKPEVNLKYQNPFTNSQYQKADFDKSVWSYSNFKMKNIPNTESSYHYAKEIFPAFKDKTFADKLVKNLGFTIKAQEQAVGEIITKVEDNKFFTISQSGYSLSFFTDLLKAPKLLETGSILNSAQTLEKTNIFIENNKLQTDYLENSEKRVIYAQMTQTGLVETSDPNQAEVSILVFYPQMKNYPLATDLSKSQISFAKDGEIVSFELETYKFTEKEKDLKLKYETKIKRSLENNEAYFPENCSALENPEKIEVSNPSLIYFLSEKNEDLQPIYQFDVKIKNASGECETIMYLPALRNEYYE